MKKNIYFLILIISLTKQGIKSQNLYVKDTFNIDIVKLNKDKQNLIINLIADSLNNYQKGGLPFFVSQYDFDYIYSTLWEGNHNPVSLRKLIFDRVNNKKCLLKIIKSKNVNYNKVSTNKTIYYNKSIIPFQSISNKQLAKSQLKNLKDVRR